MPPDPVLALLAFLGLLVYLSIGAVVGTLFVHAFDYGDQAYMRGIVNGEVDGGDAGGWIGVAMVGALWPAAIAVTLAVVVVAAVCLVLGAVPFGLMTHISRYVAASRIKEIKEVVDAT